MYSHLTQDEREKWLEPGLATGRPAFKKAVTRQDRDALQRTVFNRMSYDEKLVGGGPEVAEQVRRAQQEVYDAVDQQVTAWGIEHNEQGWRADAYLYCNEVTCPECGWRVPLAPSWVIGEKTRCIAELYPDAANQQFDIRIVSGVSSQKMTAAKTAATVKRSALACPHCGQSTPMAMLRGDRRVNGDTAYGLRLWENDDLVPRREDVFQERLYCIRWVETGERSDGLVTIRRHYREPDAHDLEREDKVLELLRERFHAWQEQGYLPSRRIEPGYNTDQSIRERDWTHWHHLFHPRQLLVQGLLATESAGQADMVSAVACLLGLGKCLDSGSRLSTWTAPREQANPTFINQALNTLSNFSVRSIIYHKTSWHFDINPLFLCLSSVSFSIDSRRVNMPCDVWLTDPPYADAVNYHELSEFFLAWYEKPLRSIFPAWYANSKRALAITGSDEGFRKSMVDCYRNLAAHIPDNGFQVVMFTHQDASVWADLALILWASGLQVTVTWTITTETAPGFKEGNYVQGTVLLVLRKQTSDDTAFLDEIYPEVEYEVKAQLDAMMALEDQEDPNFGDTDYQLAAYAAALRVLTQYKQIEDIDIAHELAKPRRRGEVSPIEQIIADAVKVACDHLVPLGFDQHVWKTLTPGERFYLKGRDLERHGEYRAGAYQELARGFGVKDYKSLLAGSKANQTRLKTASEFAAKVLGDEGFGASLVRHALFAVRETTRTGETLDGKTWLHTEGVVYWQQRKNLITILQYLSAMGLMMPHWQPDANSARLLAGALENDSV